MIIELKVYVCPNVDLFNYISVLPVDTAFPVPLGLGKGQSAHGYLPSTSTP